MYSCMCVYKMNHRNDLEISSFIIFYYELDGRLLVCFLNAHRKMILVLLSCQRNAIKNYLQIKSFQMKYSVQATKKNRLEMSGNMFP